jgi:hypothetical protein
MRANQSATLSPAKCFRDNRRSAGILQGSSFHPFHTEGTSADAGLPLIVMPQLARDSGISVGYMITGMGEL